jgi:hypothetical protein
MGTNPYEPPRDENSALTERRSKCPWIAAVSFLVFVVSGVLIILVPFLCGFLELPVEWEKPALNVWMGLFVVLGVSFLSTLIAGIGWILRLRA